MERHVYKPPKGSPKLNLFLAIVGGGLMTFACFFVIPLMKKLEAAFKRDSAPPPKEIVFEEPPEEFEAPEDDPPPEEEPEEPPEMEDQSSDLDLVLDLPDLVAGIGGGPILQIAPKFDISDNPDEFFDSGDLDQPPRATSKFPPRYPPSLLKRKVTGRVLVRALVNENGTVGEVTIKESSGHGELDRAAASAIKRWRYKPAIKGGRKVQAPVVQPFNFKVQ